MFVFHVIDRLGVSAIWPVTSTISFGPLGEVSSMPDYLERLSASWVSWRNRRGEGDAAGLHRGFPVLLWGTKLAHLELLLESCILLG